MRTLLLTFLLTFGIGSVCKADFMIGVGSNTPLLANTANQAVNIFLTSNSASDPAIKGANFGIYLGNDQASVLSGSGGVFSSVTVSSASTFWTTASGGSVTPVPTTGAAEGGVSFNSGATAVGNGNTVTIATMLIDTTGIFSGNFNISLNDPYGLSALGPFTQTQLIDGNNNVINAGPNLVLSNGSFTISAVPEPTTMALVGLGLTGVAVAARRRRGKNKRTTV